MRTGLHAQGLTDRAKIVDYYRRSGAIVFKAVNVRDNALFDELKALGVTIIYRLHTDNQSLGGTERQAFIRKLVANVEGSPQIHYAEGYNEEFADAGQIGKYAEFEIERMRALEAIGRKAAIGCFSTGTPEITDGGATWGRFRPALEHALANGHALALHEYSGPYMQYMTRTPDGRNQWNRQTNSFTGISPDPRVYWNPTLDGWLTLRYRMVYALLRAWGLDKLPLFITEGGIDDTTPRPGPGGKGYKAFRDGQWDRLPGIGDYADQRRWYLWQVSQDPFARGVVDFGWEGTPTGWPDFDLSTDPATVNDIITTEADLPKGHFGDAPVPIPTPPPVGPIKGVDVSRWQGEIDWSKMKTQGVEFGWIKAGEGANVTDPQFARNWAEARRVGVLRGAYYFYRGGVDPVMQASRFAQIVGADQGELPPALDFEDMNVRADPAAMALFARQVEAWAKCPPVIYTAAWWWNAQRLGGKQAWAARLPLWCADYSDPVDLPSTGEWSAATIHQWTSSGDGRAHGAQSAGLDLDRFFGTRAQLERLRVPSAPPTPTPAVDVARLWAEADTKQAVHLNPAAGLQRSILAAGLVPTSDEWDHTARHVAQRAESLAGGPAEVFIFDKTTGTVARHRRPT